MGSAAYVEVIVLAARQESSPRPQWSVPMAASKDAVLSALAGVKSPEGAPLPQTGKLSDIVVTDGKVFFSITVEATVVPEWEPVRKAAEAAVRAVPGVTSALVALTGERSGGQGGRAAAPSAAQPAPSPHAGRGRPSAHAAERQPAVPG